MLEYKYTIVGECSYSIEIIGFNVNFMVALVKYILI